MVGIGAAWDNGMALDKGARQNRWLTTGGCSQGAANAEPAPAQNAAKEAAALYPRHVSQARGSVVPGSWKRLKRCRAPSSPGHGHCR
jgi:hypothetical protein